MYMNDGVSAMKYLSKFWLAILIIISSPSSLIAGVDLPWSTTFDCGEYEGSEGVFSPNCDGLEAGLWADYPNTQITTDANYQNGYGYRGIRFWMGDGINHGSTQVSVVFNHTQKEFWMRWYIRYEVGFAWDPLSYDKLIYLKTSEGNSAGWELDEINNVRIFSITPSDSWASTGGGFQTMNNGQTSNGSWHCFEAHAKMDTDETDGIGEFWVDGELLISISNINYSGGDPSIQAEGWTSILFDSNQAYPANGKLMYVDWDDMAISNTGYIGPLPPRFTGGATGVSF